jgi:methylmalonyl-CoA/ethylmalonyl-CoA epimerase
MYDWEIDHLVIAVKDLEKSKNLFSTILKGKFIKELALPFQNVRAAYYSFGELIIGLETPLSNEGEVYKFLERKGEGIHHIAFQTNALEELQQTLSENEIHIIGYGEEEGIKKEFFTHPKSSLGVLLQLIEWEEPYKESFRKRLEILGEEK